MISTNKTTKAIISTDVIWRPFARVRGRVEITPITDLQLTDPSTRYRRDPATAAAAAAAGKRRSLVGQPASSQGETTRNEWRGCSFLAGSTVDYNYRTPRDRPVPRGPGAISGVQQTIWVGALLQRRFPIDLHVVHRTKSLFYILCAVQGVHGGRSDEVPRTARRC